MKDILHDGSHSVKPSGCICFTKKIDCYVYYYIYYVCWYRYRICIAQLAVFTENRKEYITHYLPAAVCFGNLYRLQQLNHLEFRQIRMAGGYIGYIKHFGQYASFFPGISSVF